MSDAIVRALVPCSLAFQDKAGRWCLIGTFDQINVPTLPSKYEFHVYLRAADMAKKGVARLDIKDVTGALTFSTGAIPYEIMDDVRELESVTLLKQVHFVDQGDHRLEAYFGNTLAGSWPLRVVNVGRVR